LVPETIEFGRRFIQFQFGIIMPFNWKDFLILAENLQAAPDHPGPSEAALRSATSRAYYAAFRAAVELGKKWGFMPKGSGDDHKGIRMYFLQFTPADERKKTISTQLDRLYDLRRQADYESNPNKKPENMAVYSIGMAKKVFVCIDELSK
jgi:uncharacterized protein (UPF0332 family)